MKKIIWGIMLLVSIVGIVLCIIYVNGSKENGESWNEKNLKLDFVFNTENEEIEETESQEKIEEKEDVVNFDIQLSDEIMNIDSTMRNMGYSPSQALRDELNRPEPIVSLQGDFGEKYNATFIGDKSEGIYLTFTISYEYIKDGIRNTDKILDILKEKNVKAAFFVTGEYVESQPEMCKKIVDMGHNLGCHGWEHPSNGVASYDVEHFVEDTKKIYNELYKITGKEPYMYRFGSGIWNERALAILDEFGFDVIFHSYTYMDYDIENQMSESTALKMLTDNLHNGEILYLHTISDTNINIMSEFIDIVREKGYEFESFYKADKN